MTLVDSKSFARVVVIAPRTRVDLALPVDVAIVDLLPPLLELVGERTEDGGGRHGGWKLARVGAAELPSDRTLRSLEILDGTALHLTPREAPAAPPIYDDVVDAIASVVRSRLSVRGTNPAAGAAAATTALAVAAITVLYRGHSTLTNYLAATTAIVVLALATAVARGPGERVIATALAAGGVPFAFVLGIEAVPGSLGRSGVLLGFSLALLYSVIAPAALGTGTVVFIATTVLTAFGAGASAICVGFHVEPVRAAAGAGAVSIAAISILPWLVVRLSRLPLPFIPTSAADFRDRPDEIDIDEVTDRARLADEYLNGAYIGCSVSVAFTAAIVAMHGSALAIAFAGVCLAALALRTRSIIGLVPRAAMLASCVASAAGAGLFAILFFHKHPTLWVFGAAVIGALLAVLVSVAGPRTRLTPSSLRSIDFFEATLLISILPLAAGVMDLYAVMRHL